MIKQAARSNLVKTYPRCHYNSKGKTKKQYETEEDAARYISIKHLHDYTIYLCKVCNKYHISHKNKKE
jgi:hypothetical protein